MISRLCLALVLCGGLSACSDSSKGPEGDAGDPFGNAANGGGAGKGTGGKGGSGSGSSTGGTGSSVGGSGSVIGGGSCVDCEVCKHIDMIISVDGSSSMTEELQAIRDEVFPSFADRLLEISGGIDDFRVGTIDACPDPANYHTRGNAGECMFFGGHPWIESASPKLRDEFQCVGDIYQGDQNCTGNNDDEQPASAAARSLEKMFATGANANFSRADALLVIVAITDEDEQPTSSAMSAQQVYDRIVAAKGGDPKRIMFLGIGGSHACQGAYGGAEEARKMKDIVDLFKKNGHGVFWDLCKGHLADGLEEAYNSIESACTDLPPPPMVPPPYSEGPT